MRITGLYTKFNAIMSFRFFSNFAIKKTLMTFIYMSSLIGGLALTESFCRWEKIHKCIKVVYICTLNHFSVTSYVCAPKIKVRYFLNQPYVLSKLVWELQYY